MSKKSASCGNGRSASASWWRPPVNSPSASSTASPSPTAASAESGRSRILRPKGLPSWPRRYVMVRRTRRRTSRDPTRTPGGTADPLRLPRIPRGFNTVMWRPSPRHRGRRVRRSAGHPCSRRGASGPARWPRTGRGAARQVAAAGRRAAARVPACCSRLRPQPDRQPGRVRRWHEGPRVLVGIQCRVAKDTAGLRVGTDQPGEGWSQKLLWFTAPGSGGSAEESSASAGGCRAPSRSGRKARPHEMGSTTWCAVCRSRHGCEFPGHFGSGRSSR